MTLKQEILFYPAWDKTNPDPQKNYGIHGVEIRFYLIGKSGAVQFVLYTNWYLEHNLAAIRKNITAETSFMLEPMPADVGYHSKVAQYEGQEATMECDVIHGECYYDGSGLQAQEAFHILKKEGSEGLWRYLEKEYIGRFGEENAQR